MRKIIYQKKLVFIVLLTILSASIFPTFTLKAKGEQLDDNVVGCWSFDEAGGDIADDMSTYDNDGVINGASWTTGVSNSALNFDGSDDYVLVSHNPSLVPENAITVSSWVRLESFTSGWPYHAAIVGKGGCDVRSGYELQVSYASGGDSNQKLFWRAFPGGKMTELEIDYSGYLNQWHFLVGTCDDEYIRIYIDGNLIAEKKCSGSLRQNENPLYIGRRDPKNHFDKFLDGAIDEVKIYNTALSSDDIKAIYEKPSDKISLKKWEGNGHYYDIVQKEVDWQNAKEYAKKQEFEEKTTGKKYKGHLATITSPQENSWIVENIISSMDAQDICLWLGGYQQEGYSNPSEGWQWITGEPWAWANWNEGEPNDAHGGERFLEMYAWSGKWNDEISSGWEEWTNYILIEYEPTVAEKIEIKDKVHVDNHVRFYTGNEPGIDYPSNYVPLEESAFEDSLIDKEDLLYILNIAYQIEMDITGENYVNELDIVYILRDKNKDTSSFYAGWTDNPPCIKLGREASLIRRDGFPYWPYFFHEMGHIFSLNAIGENSYYLGRIQSKTSNFLTDTTACMYAAVACQEMIAQSNKYNIPYLLEIIFTEQYEEEKSVQKKGYDNYTDGYFYCCGQKSKPMNYFNKVTEERCGPEEKECDIRALITQQAADYVYIQKAEDADNFNDSLKEYMKIIKNIKDEKEISFLKYDKDNEEELECSNQHRASLYAAAVSKGLGIDLRQTYKDLEFPIDDCLFYYYLHDRDSCDKRVSWFRNPFFDGLNININELGYEDDDKDVEMEIPGGLDPDWGVHGYNWNKTCCDIPIDECKFISEEENNDYNIYVYGRDDTHAKKDKDDPVYSAVTLIQGDIWKRDVPWHCPKPLIISRNDIFIDIYLKKGESKKLCASPENGRVMYAINVWLKDSSIDSPDPDKHENFMVLDLIFYLGEEDTPDLFFDNNGFHFQEIVSEELKENEWMHYCFNLNKFIRRGINKASSGEVEDKTRQYNIDKMTIEQAEILIELVHAEAELTVRGFDLYYYPKDNFDNNNKLVGETVDKSAENDFDIPDIPGFEILFLLFAAVSVIFMKRRKR